MGNWYDLILILNYLIFKYFCFIIYIGNSTSEDRIKLSEGNRVIEVENITLQDRGNFTCIVKNEYMNKSFTAVTFVRVKGKF